MRPRRIQFSLRFIITLVTLLTVLCTALLVHIPWYYTATRNVEDTVKALNRQIINGISREVDGILDDTVAALHALHSVLSHEVVAVTHQAKREFLFLAHLQSHPSISWVSFGWPDGSFFGAHKVCDNYIQMVETLWNADTGSAVRRLDHYNVDDGDIWFERREFQLIHFAPDRPWYRQAMNGDGDAWTDVYTLPVSGKPGISVATRLTLGKRIVGVINVAIALERLSLYLQSIPVAKTGAVFIVNRRNELIASQHPGITREDQSEHDKPRLGNIADYSELAIAFAALTSRNLGVGDIDQPREFTRTQPDGGERHFVTFAPLGHAGWVVVTVIPESDFLTAINRSTWRLVFNLLGLIAGILILAIFISRIAIDKPLSGLAGQLKLIEEFKLEQTARIASPIREIEVLSAAIAQMAHGLAAFRRYLPTTLVRTLIKEGIESKPQSRVATILFTDIEDFTAMGESMSPESLIALLNDYFCAVTGPIERRNGVILQYQGDAILAAFNVPVDDPDHAANAVQAALEIQQILKQRIFAGGIVLKTRIGINTGPVVAASVGSRERINYTVHGDAVNLAARLERLNKDYGTRIIVSQHTAELLGEEFNCQQLGQVFIRGKQAPVTVHKVAC